MNTQKEVYKMLFKESKTELATQKIELSLIDDVQSAEIKASKNYEASMKKTFKILSDLDAAILDVKTAVSIAEKTMSKVKELDKKAKELGVKLDAKTDKAAQNLYDIAELGGKQHLKDLQKMKSAI